MTDSSAARAPKEEEARPERPEMPSKKFIHNFRLAAKIGQPLFYVVLAAVLIWKLVPRLSSGQFQDSFLFWYESLQQTTYHLSGPLLVALAAILLLGLWRRSHNARDVPVYLVDFRVYRPPDALRVNKMQCRDGANSCGKFNEESLAFQQRIAERSGLGERTYLPRGLHQYPFDINMTSAREEAEMVMFNCVGNLLEHQGLKPRDIDILIVNCSLFNPTPSLSAMIINHFKMRSDIVSYNLSGMGCSAGLIAISLARELLQVYPNKNAIVVSTENITQNWYFGNERSMLIPNVLFRMGGAAILLSNKPAVRNVAKYELQHVIRVHMGADDKAYRCVFQRPDDDGNIGVELNKDLFKVASKAVTRNMTRMGPMVLPWSEMLFVALNLLAAKVFRMRVKPYVPDFKKAFDHFCLHAGGRAVIEGLGKQLGLPDEKTEASFQTLKWYGNTSSSTVWYSLAYIESVQTVKEGEHVWQVAFGSGFKCNSAVWKAIRDIDSCHQAWEHRVGENAPKV
ncbi:unnamed protein product [Ostreobium quekettii]|uniref:3-ketoacyl-CoA synthase n=1 Tax=Ostreobium quekettii TaxID=121088 RepID=A0A8S1ILN7_9CHLO|nr:unnamed protein product [Ostreobium quekettii]|eukprot:evm.model.scf_763.4 EVM.evm.TU.scf_763.4   scf_763:31522-38539(+)